MKHVVPSTMLVAVLSFAGVMSVAYSEQQAPTREEMLQEMRALRSRAEGLNTRVQSMDSIAEHLTKDISKLMKETADVRAENVPDQVRWEIHLERISQPEQGSYSSTKPDIAAMRALELPENPTREQVMEYVKAVKEASGWRSTPQPDDPEVRLLVRVGQENLFELIRASTRYPYRAEHILHAIRQLATEDHKRMIVGSLTHRPELLSIIRERGWTIDARDALIEIVEKEDSWRSRDAMDALVSLDDPVTVEAILKQIKKEGASGRLAATILANPELKISRALAEAGAFDKNPEVRSVRLRQAAEQGDVNALIEFAETKSAGRTTLAELTGVWGTEAEVKAWIKENADQLIYDADRRMYRHSFEGGDLRLNVLSAPADDDNIDVYGRLSLPQNATADDVRRYIAQVLEMSTSCACCYSPRMIMLSLVGRDNLDILVEFLHTHPSDRDLIGTICKLVEPQDKYYIVGKLIDVPSLTAVVLDKGWLPDARGQIIWALEAAEQPFGDTKLEALVEEGDAEIRQAVIHYVRRTQTSIPGWALGRIPVSELEEILLNVWEKARDSGEEVPIGTAIEAVRYGSGTALEYALDQIASNRAVYEDYNDPLQELLRYLDTEGEIREVNDWYTANKGKLVYDPFYKIFEVRE